MDQLFSPRDEQEVLRVQVCEERGQFTVFAAFHLEAVADLDAAVVRVRLAGFHQCHHIFVGDPCSGHRHIEGLPPADAHRLPVLIHDGFALALAGWKMAV